MSFFKTKAVLGHYFKRYFARNYRCVSCGNFPKFWKNNRAFIEIFKIYKIVGKFSFENWKVPIPAKNLEKFLNHSHVRNYVFFVTSLDYKNYSWYQPADLLTGWRANSNAVVDHSVFHGLRFLPDLPYCLIFCTDLNCIIDNLLHKITESSKR